MSRNHALNLALSIPLVCLSLQACGGCTSSNTSEDAGSSGTASGGSSGSSGQASSSGSSGASSGSSGASGGTSSGSSGASSGSSGSSSGGSSSGTSGSATSNAGPTVLDLLVTPSPAALVVNAGVGGTLDLVVEAVLSDGTRRPARSPYFRSQNPEIGTMTGATFSATGERGGVARVRVRADGREVLHAITVSLVEQQVTPGAPGGIETAFTGPVAAAPTPPAMLYPYDQVVIPLNLAPMLFQWQVPFGGAWFHLRVEGARGSLDLYTADNSAAPTPAAWRRLLETHAGATLDVTLEAVASPGGERHVAARQVIKLATADLTATVYYWALNLGRLVRIDADSLAPQPLEMTGSPNGCYGCHALSKDGTRLSFTFNGGWEPGGVINPGVPGTNIVGPDANKKWNWAVFSPDNRFMLTNISNTITLRDANTGDVVPGGDAVAPNAAHPAWSHEGDRVAYASIAGGSEIDFDQSDLVVRSVDALSGFPADVLTTFIGGGKALFYPNFSSDGQFLAFNRGDHSRSGFDDRGQRFPATIELADLVMGGTPTVLARANPGNNSYQPTFSPFVEGGYMWIAFFSRRDYGHRLTSGERQLWVAAIDQNPTVGVDGSHPAFWLPGQEISTLNMAPFFARKPCQPAGGGCTSDLGCCGGNLCRPDGTEGALTCTPPELACSLPGDACMTDGDCCVGAGTCFDDGTGMKKCTPPELQCRNIGGACQFNEDCCVGQGSCFDNGNGMPVCTPPENQCIQNMGACDDQHPCCEGAGTCRVSAEGGDRRCLTDAQACSPPLGACNTNADCCPGNNAACVTNTSTGMKQCLRPTDQCRSAGQSCTEDMDCCGGGTQLICDGNVCDSGGG